MSTLLAAGTRSHRTLRLAVVTAALGVAGCFTAAFTFADQPAQAAEAAEVLAAD